MTDEPAYTVTKERMAPEVMFLTELTPQLSITDSKVKWPLCCYVQPISQHYKRRKAPPQSIQSPRKIWMIPIYKHREAVLWYAKRHLSG